jgi:putative heme-binding domain-containing protein
LSDNELIALLTDANIFLRQRASVLLSHRLRSTDTNQPQGQQTFELLLSSLQSALQQASDSPPLYLAQTTLHAPQLNAAQLVPLLNTSSPLLTSWAIQAAATRKVSDGTVRNTIQSLAASPDPRVRLQVAIAANKLAGDQATAWLLQVLQHSQDDGLLPRIVWQNLLPHVVNQRETIIAALAKSGRRSSNDSPAPLITQLAPRIAARILADVQPDLKAPEDAQACRALLDIAATIADNFPEHSTEVIETLLSKLQTSEVRPEAAQSILSQWFRESPEAKALAAADGALLLRCYANDTQAIQQVAASLTDNRQPVERRVRSLRAITSLPTSPRDEVLPQLLSQWMKELQSAQQVPSAWQTALLEAVIEHGAATTRSQLVEQLPQLPIGLQATIAERLSQREATALLLLDSISQGSLSKDIVGPNQVRLLAAHRSESVRQATAKIWGTVRLDDSQERQKVIREINQFLARDARGDASRGVAVYDRICGQCHQMHDRGFEVGPNITRNGRGSFEQLLVSVFDPSSVIGEAYKSVTVLTQDGRVLNGIVTENSDQRIVLKLQGGKEEIIPTAMIDEVKQNPQSLMPEGLEQQMTRAELADLFALLTLEQPPSTRENSTISGTPQQLHSP